MLPIECLIKQYTIEEAEMESLIEHVNDERVPKVPFGFINDKWNEFKSCITDRDELWSYSANYGWLNTEAGFAILSPDNRMKTITKLFMIMVS